MTRPAPYFTLPSSCVLSRSTIAGIARSTICWMVGSAAAPDGGSGGFGAPGTEAGGGAAHAPRKTAARSQGRMAS